MKKSLIAFAMVLMAAAVNAEAMYWQVSQITAEGAGTNVKADSYKYAQVHVYTGNAENGYTSVGYLNALAEDGWTTDGALISTSDAGNGAWFDLTGYNKNDTTYSFVLELVNSDLQVVGASQYQSYDTIKGQSGVVQNLGSILPSTYTAWNQGFVSIPEPTSGLMLLLGASLLALRRKRA